MRFAPYLYFKGACEEALRFYAARGLDEIRDLRRYDGAPLANSDGGAWRNKVLHAEFEGPARRFFASDGADAEPMKGCALFLEFDDIAAVKSLFERLRDGGRVTVRFARQFWGDVYGNFTAGFGVQWAVICRSAH